MAKVRGSVFRRMIFWVHLVCGLITGVVVAIMSITGIAIAFEEEILEWVDRDLGRVEMPVSAERLTIVQMREQLSEARPAFAANYVVVPAEADRAYAFFIGRKGPLYVDPYSGAVGDSNREAAHHVIHEIEEWHRFLGMKGDQQAIGKMITGVSNLAFLVLCVTGLYLWLPKMWSLRSVKAIVLLKRGAKAKARDYNWHNVFGIWSLPVLVVLVATAVVISFEWGHKLIFTLAGEEPPKSRNFGMMAVEPAVVEAPFDEARQLEYEQLLQVAQQKFPEWERMGLHLMEPSDEGAELTPVKIDVTVPDYMPSRAWVPIELDPYTGAFLKVTRFEDRSPGLQARVWVRFLHTGAAFGLIGKIVATIATAASLVLVYTGFALSYRRFFGKRRAS